MSNIDYPADNLRAFCDALRDNSDLEAMRRFAAKEPDLFRKLREKRFPDYVVLDAGKRSSPEAIRLLIELGADVNEQDSNGGTGLDWAVTRGRYIPLTSARHL